MKITKVICQILRIDAMETKTAGTQDTLIVRIQSDSGHEGIGEADASPEVVKAIFDAPYSHNIACGLRELLIGMNPLEPDVIPMTLGLASGLRIIVWKIYPEMPKAKPANNPASMRGRRIVPMANDAPLISSPANTARTSRTG